MSRLSQYRGWIDIIKAKYNHARERVKEERRELVAADAHLSHAIAAQEIVQSVAQSIQQHAHDRIAGIVSRCLAIVFGEEAYEFRIHFERKRGRTEARLAFKRGEHELDPRSGTGGGVIDVASFALRLACLMLSRPAPRRLLVLDEPFKFVHSPLYRARVAEMLETLASEMDFQFIISTGIVEYHIGKVIEID